VFLKYPELELSTNLAENAMRAIAIIWGMSLSRVLADERRARRFK
jgi:hypothetical protein